MTVLATSYLHKLIHIDDCANLTIIFGFLTSLRSCEQTSRHAKCLGFVEIDLWQLLVYMDFSG